MVLHCFFHKSVDLLGYLLSSIKQRLFLVVLPVERQIEHPNRLPEIPQLRAGTVDNSGHFVSNNEFQVLHDRLSINSPLWTFIEFEFLIRDTQ